MNADGSKQTRLTNNDSSDECPVWASDGQHIAFTSRKNGSEEIYMMSPDGCNQTNVTDHPADDSYSDWSPKSEGGNS